MKSQYSLIEIRNIKFRRYTIMKLPQNFVWNTVYDQQLQNISTG